MRGEYYCVFFLGMRRKGFGGAYGVAKVVVWGKGYGIAEGLAETSACDGRWGFRHGDWDLVCINLRDWDSVESGEELSCGC